MQRGRLERLVGGGKAALRKEAGSHLDSQGLGLLNRWRVGYSWWKCTFMCKVWSLEDCNFQLGRQQWAGGSAPCSAFSPLATQKTRQPLCAGVPPCLPPASLSTGRRWHGDTVDLPGWQRTARLQ